MKEVIICLPAYNEAGNLPPLFERFEKVFVQLGVSHRYVICNDGSRDGTAEVLSNWQTRVSMEVLTHTVNQGLGPTLRYALRRGTETASLESVILTMDADNTHPPEILGGMLEGIKAGHNLMIASRYRVGASVEGLSWTREMLSLGARLLFQCSFPIRGVRDYTCGYRLYTSDLLKRAWERYGDALVSEKGFACMADLLLKISTLGLNCGEVPLLLQYGAKQGASKMRVGRTIMTTLKLMLLRRFGVGMVR
ncbi:MAG: glycosyltransferase [bacterium]